MAISMIKSYLRNNINFSLFDAFKVDLSRLGHSDVGCYVVSGCIGLVIHKSSGLWERVPRYRLLGARKN